MSNEKIQVKILGVNKEADIIRYESEGKEHTSTVIAPADIKYAREGDATIQINEHNYICYVRMEKKGNFTGHPKPMHHATGKSYSNKTKMEVSEDISAQDIKGVYNDFASKHNVKASNIFPTKDGLFTIFIFYQEGF